MKYTVITQPELTAIAGYLIREAANQRDLLAVTAISSIGGDRIHCCDEGIVARTFFGNVVGLSTIAPRGESGDGSPEIVGVFVGKGYRRRGVGRALLIRAIKRCEERGLRPNMIAVTNGGWSLIESLPQDVKDACGEIRKIPGIEAFPF
ncbi:MAG TPA: GNAT family N-acetyltransferase [Candidatus Paceibacterota bacterium]|nr:GNAT family N-acetyltransferase [Candidatus Paceibacterota bacterium]